jgi:hypothetical protein
MSGLSERWWVTVAVFLLALIVAGIASLSTRGERGESLAIRLSHSPRVELEVYVGGAVDAPGVYPFREAISSMTCSWRPGASPPEPIPGG